MAAPARTPNGTNPSDTCTSIYVSDPIAAGAITGTIKGQALCLENAAANNICAQLLMKVVSNDGLTVRGTSFAHITTAQTNEFTITTRTNRFLPRGGGSPSLTSVTALANDRIVFEIGIRQESTNVTSFGHIQFGDNSATDLTEDETATANDNPWIELSQTITFATAAVLPPLPLVVDTAVMQAANN
jgi:hypothetical protein